MNSVVAKLFTANWSWSGCKGLQSSYWMYSATKCRCAVISHWWTQRLPVFIAAHVFKWQSSPASEDDYFSNQVSIPRRALSIFSGMGGFVFEDGVVRIWALRAHICPFILCYYLGMTSSWGLAFLLLLLWTLNMNAGLLSTFLWSDGSIGGRPDGIGGKLDGPYALIDTLFYCLNCRREWKIDI